MGKKMYGKPMTIIIMIFMIFSIASCGKDQEKNEKKEENHEKKAANGVVYEDRKSQIYNFKDRRKRQGIRK